MTKVGMAPRVVLEGMTPGTLKVGDITLKERKIGTHLKNLYYTQEPLEPQIFLSPMLRSKLNNEFSSSTSCPATRGLSTFVVPSDFSYCSFPRTPSTIFYSNQSKCVCYTVVLKLLSSCSSWRKSTSSP